MTFVGDLRGYTGVKQVWKAAGVNLIEYSSGQHKGKHTISHMGNPLLRHLLYQAAVHACCFPDSLFRDWYLERVEGQKKPVKVVLVACTRRLLKIAYAVARDNVPFDPSRYVSSLSSTRPFEPERDQSSAAMIDPAVA